MTRAGQADIPGRRKARKIEGQYIAHRLAMIESPAYRVLSFHARRCLDRIEIEHLRHGGNENGQLPVTYDQFIEYGVMSRRFIGPALRELEALGFIEITEHGCAGNAAYRAPNKFRLTYIPAEWKATDEWRRIKTCEEAMTIAQKARAKKPGKWRIEKQKPVPQIDVFRFTHRNHEPPNGDQSPGHPWELLSIYLGSRTSATEPVHGEVDELDGAVDTVQQPHPSTEPVKPHKPPENRRKNRPKLPWAKPVITEVYPGQRSTDHLKALYKHQAEQDGQPDDAWIPPPSPSARVARELSGNVDPRNSYERDQRGTKR
jgi:hypothetical protein